MKQTKAELIKDCERLRESMIDYRDERDGLKGKLLDMEATHSELLRNTNHDREEIACLRGKVMVYERIQFPERFKDEELHEPTHYIQTVPPFNP